MVEGEPIRTGDRGSCRRHEFVLRRRVVRCICAAPVIALLALIGGFLWFALHIANEESPRDRAADGIVALTGGASRITDAVELLASGRGRRLLITGVGPTTNAAELVRLAPDYERWFGCCIELDYTAINTVGNAAETRRWARERGFRSLVVVTSGYHMPRAMLEIGHRLPDVITIRSILFNLLFYLNLAILLIAAIPTLIMPRRAILGMAKLWGRTTLWLLRVVCHIEVEWRGLEKIPPGGILVAAKHQSAWETFALLTLFPDPAYVIKRELMWIPFFGWYTWHGGMIPVDRGAGKAALSGMTGDARRALAEGRQIIIFPEGTRRPAGADPKYKFGVAHLYAAAGVPCVPIALNSGLFWPRRRFLRFPGTVRVEILDPIRPGLDRDAFFAKLQEEIETATARLIAEGRRG